MGELKYDIRKGKEVWLYCNLCKKYTCNIVLTGVDDATTEEIEGGHSSSWSQACDIVQCGGCKTITFIKRSWDSEFYSPGDDEIIQQYPVKEDEVNSHVLSHFYAIPPLLRNIYKETLHAISNKAYTLSAIGMRAVVETLCKDKAVKGTNLEERIDNLADEGFLTSLGAEVLHSIRLIGNDAAHEVKAPKKEQIQAALSAVDHLILGIYVIPQQAEQVLPKRKKKQAKQPSSNEKAEV